MKTGGEETIDDEFSFAGVKRETIYG